MNIRYIIAKRKGFFGEAFFGPYYSYNVCTHIHTTR